MKKLNLEIDIMVSYECYHSLTDEQKNNCFCFTQELQRLFNDKIQIENDSYAVERPFYLTNRRSYFDIELFANTPTERTLTVDSNTTLNVSCREFVFPDGESTGLFRVDGLYEDILENLHNQQDLLLERALNGKLKEHTFSFSSAHENLQRTKFFFGARYLWQQDQLAGENASVAKGIRVDVDEVEDWMYKAGQRLVDAGYMQDSYVNQFAANTYHDGSMGISPHFDDIERFYPYVYALRLFNDTRLSFGCGVWGKGGGKFAIDLPLGCVLIMQGDAKAMRTFKHSIRPEDLTGKNGVMLWRRIREQNLIDANDLFIQEEEEKEQQRKRQMQIQQHQAQHKQKYLSMPPPLDEITTPTPNTLL